MTDCFAIVNTMRILIVEDDEVLTDILLESLKKQHYTVDAVNDGKLGWDYAQSTDYDLLLVDIGLPRMDGISLCRQLREEGYRVPILLITAKDAITERIRGLDAGADDYLFKPLNLEELHARLRALLRRKEVQPNLVLEAGGLRLDPSLGKVNYDDRPIELTPKEYMLLELFLRNPSRLFSRGSLIEHLWTYDEIPLEDSVKAHIKGLRRKLKQAGMAEAIENVYGMGYRFQLPDLSPIAARSEDRTIEREFTRSMAQLWQQYGGLMQQRLDAIQAAIVALNGGVLGRSEHLAAKQAAHKLAGILGMFDRDEGTLLAREIEELLETEALTLEDGITLSDLFQRLSLILNLQEISPQQTSELNPKLIIPHAKVTIVGGDDRLVGDLQEFTKSELIAWQQLKNPERAIIELKTSHIDLLIAIVSNSEQWDVTLNLIADLAARTPAIPSLILTNALSGTQKDDAISFMQRVAIVRAGGTVILPYPTTIDRIWEAASRLLERRLRESVKVLIVDDDPCLLSAVSPLLELWGMRATGLENPLKFWEVLAITDPDLLILDIEMPELSGIELCKAVRSDPQWQALPILFLTGCRDRQTIQRIFAAGADDYLHKPVVESELLTRITNRLERNRLLRGFYGKFWV
jgi:DNA-binding response OmpR family regulator